MKTKAPSMADLMSAWQEAKAEESAANAKRLEIEKLPEPAPAPVAPDTTVGASGYTVAEEAAAAGVRG